MRLLDWNKPYARCLADSISVYCCIYLGLLQNIPWSRPLSLQLLWDKSFCCIVPKFSIFLVKRTCKNDEEFCSEGDSASYIVPLKTVAEKWVFGGQQLNCSVQNEFALSFAWDFWKQSDFSQSISSKRWTKKQINNHTLSRRVIRHNVCCLMQQITSQRHV